MNTIVKYQNRLKIFLIAALGILLLFFISSSNIYPMSAETKRKEFLNRIPETAEKFIGIPYQYGGNFKESGVIDNSHLFYNIYDEAARHSDLTWKGYLRINELFELSTEVKRQDVRNGDLVFLNNGHAAMIYKFNSQDDFNLIYSSFKRQRVITFHCRNVAFKYYWLKNLKGYYRPAKNLLSP